MQIDSIDIVSSDLTNSNVFSLSPDVYGQFQVKGITGLDADEIIQSYYATSLDDSKKFYEYALKPRTIVIRAATNPNFKIGESYSDIRDQLYKIISSTRSGELTLLFKDGANVVAMLMGHITKFEVPYFQKLPEVQITIECNNPIFKGVSPIEITLVDNTTELLTLPDSISTAPHGFTLKFRMTAAAAELNIHDPDGEWEFAVNISGGFLTNDVIEISSVYDNRYVTITRSSVTSQIAEHIQPDSVWPIIFPGVNEFEFDQSNHADWQDVARYYPAYWGI